MRIEKRLIDPNPNEPIHEFGVITFLKTDLSRGAVKGRSAVVVDISENNEFKYTVEIDMGDNFNRGFARHEFRSATKPELERLRLEWKKRMERREKREAEDLAWKKPPEMPELGEDAFKSRK